MSKQTKKTIFGILGGIALMLVVGYEAARNLWSKAPGYVKIPRGLSDRGGFVIFLKFRGRSPC